MKKLILHIGSIKTGSTSIQTHLFHNRTALQEEGYDLGLVKYNGNSRMLALYGIEDGRTSSALDEKEFGKSSSHKRYRELVERQFAQEMEDMAERGIHTVIMSSEQLQKEVTTQVGIERIKALVAPFFDEITVVCYLREQAASLVSRYSTAIRAGLDTPLEERVLNCTQKDIGFNYYNMLSQWRLVFGANNLVVKLFDRDLFKHGSLIVDFLEGISPTLVNISSPSDVMANQSMSSAGQSLGRAVNRALHLSALENKHERIRKRMMKTISSAFQGAGADISDQDALRLYKHFNASNVKLNEEFLGGRAGENCFKQYQPRETTNRNSISKDDLHQLEKIIQPLCLNLASGYSDSKFLQELALELIHTDVETAASLSNLAKVFSDAFAIPAMDTWGDDT